MDFVVQPAVCCSVAEHAACQSMQGTSWSVPPHVLAVYGSISRESMYCSTADGQLTADIFGISESEREHFSTCSFTQPTEHNCCCRSHLSVIPQCTETCVHLQHTLQHKC
jgi:hypothetical protein